MKELESTRQGVAPAESQTQTYSHASSRPIHCVLTSTVLPHNPECYSKPAGVRSTFHNFSTNLPNLCEHPINLTLRPLLFLHPWKRTLLLLSQAKCPASAWYTSPVSQPGKLICNSVIFIVLSFFGTSHDR